MAIPIPSSRAGSADTKDDLLALPAAISSFNGFYNHSGKFILMNSIHILVASAVLVGVVFVAFVSMVVRFLRRRSRRRRLQAVAGAD